MGPSHIINNFEHVDEPTINVRFVGGDHVPAGAVLEALGITDYDTTDENGNVTTDTAAFAQDIRLAVKHQRDKAQRAAEKDAAKRLSKLVRS